MTRYIIRRLALLALASTTQPAVRERYVSRDEINAVSINELKSIFEAKTVRLDAVRQ